MTPPTLSQLLAQQSVGQVFDTLIGVCQAAGFPTTAWQAFDIDRTRLMAMATGIEDVIAKYIPAIAGGSFLDYAPLFPGWTELMAAQFYNLPINPATFTLGNLLATNSSITAQPFTTAAPLKITFGQSGNSYFTTGNGTIPGSGTLSIPVIAENAGAKYNDANNVSGIVLTTPLPGVTISNPASAYTTITQTGSGTGTLTLGGSPIGPHSLIIAILSTGQAGSAAWSYSLDGAPAVNAGAVTTLTNIGGAGINVTLANGAINPSFVINDTYAFATPGSWITSQGSDIETNPALAGRCRTKWATQSVVPTQSLYQFLAKSTPSVGSQVTQCFVVPDATINNKINVVVSGPGGVLPGPTITLIQNYLTPRARGCDRPLVQSPATLAITIAGTLTVDVSQLIAVQSALVTELNDYIAGIPVNGTIRISAILASIVPDPVTGKGGIPGVIDCTGITINGAAANLTLGGVGSYVLPSYPPTLNITYVSQ